jgi:hypothetical protein
MAKGAGRELEFELEPLVKHLGMPKASRQAGPEARNSRLLARNVFWTRWAPIGSSPN